MATTATRVTCGACRQQHGSVEEVRACYAQRDADKARHPASQEPVATEKQVGLILRLCRERGISVDEDATRRQSRQTASEVIDGLLKTPKPVSPPQPVAEPESGMYRHPGTGDILKVYRAVHGSGRMCAKRLRVPGVQEWAKAKAEGRTKAEVHFDYLGLATRFLRGYERMTLEQAREFGAIYGVCCVCSRTLTDEGSIAAGIGPVCASKL